MSDPGQTGPGAKTVNPSNRKCLARSAGGAHRRSAARQKERGICGGAARRQGCK